MRTRPLASVLAALCAPLCCAAQEPAAGSPQAPARPNVVFLMADELGHGDATVSGGWIPTPRLVALAQQGARFTQAYAAASLNTPSHAGILTGQYPARHGVHSEIGHNSVSRNRERGLPTEVVTLPERLRELGYHSGLVGKWDLGLNNNMRPAQQGFAEFYGFFGEGRPYLFHPKTSRLLRGDELEDEGERAYLTDAWAREAVSFLSRNKAGPFFLCVSFNAPHAPLEAPPEYLQRFPNLQGEQQTYAAMVSALDDGVGKILDALDQEGLSANTLVFFLSGNGAGVDAGPGRNTPFNLGKGYLFEGGLRVPLLLRWPGRVAAGTSVATPVSLLDLAATALEAAGADDATLAELDGKDLLPVLAGSASERTLLWRSGASCAMRKGDWKLITSKDSSWLFDLAQDPTERKDLAEQEPARVEAMKAELKAWTRTNPPKLWPLQEPPSPPSVFQKTYWMNF